ncbi:hypothetical protein CCAN12_670027 [Capnocytophaga canimorsus]|uniref:50S ribosomal protein L15 n=1 Tax=Capnocytophaga canimorsus TaxID=28188 RepID=A0A0B7HDK7_9FLAO|nr:hypothetical protein CCAN12_670027 [Capnocytophaga canimorsus]
MVLREVRCLLQRRVPKFGFKNINRKEYVGINLGQLQQMVDAGKITDTGFDFWENP